MKMNKIKLLSLFLLLVLELNYLLPLPALAQTSTNAPPSVTYTPPATQGNQTSNALPTASFPTLLAANPSLPSLDTGSQPLQDSAFTRTSPIVQKLPKKQYRSDEAVSVAIANPQNDTFTVAAFDAKGAKSDGATEQINSDNGTTFAVFPRAQFRPGKYKLVVTDADGRSSTQDFSWGVLALNTDRSIYLPGQTADLAMAVLDDQGNMVCDAKLDLKITTTSRNSNDELSTDNGKIIANQQCQSHNFSLKPDYEAHYQVRAPGTYTLNLTAQTKNGTYAIADQLTVQDAVPFDVERVSATRIYPPNTYPVQVNVTANQNFTGTVTETVPDSFTITTSTDSASTQSYDNMQTVYLNQGTNPATKLTKNLSASQTSTTLSGAASNGSLLVKGGVGRILPDNQVLAASTSALLLPFTGSYPITEGFGAQQTDPALSLFYQHYGLAGHDGVDFGLPMGTPVRAVDDGTVVLAGPGDYGITIVIQHTWGKSYYGHLSQVLVTVGQQVGKGVQIGVSGNTGEATGPHLHFGMKPNNPDMSNGYFGKIDPLPYFNLPSDAQVTDGSTVGAGEKNLLPLLRSRQRIKLSIEPVRGKSV